MEIEQTAPRTEEQIRQDSKTLKLVIGGYGLLGTLAFIAVAWYVELSNWVIWSGAMVLFEIVSFVFVLRALNNGRDQNLAELREEQGLTPASQLPDVGI
jgi:membrane protein YdbS with pleckstrin-like domain